MRKRETYFDGWRLYPLACAYHHAQGIFAGALLGTGEPVLMQAAFMHQLIFFAYEGLSWLRKHDSAGWDAADFWPCVPMALLVHFFS